MPPWILMFAAAAQSIEVTQSASVLIVAGIGFAGTIIASIIGVILTTRYSAKSAKAAIEGAKGIEVAKEAASDAAAAASDAARNLVESARTSSEHLASIQDAVETTRTVAAGVHLIVNNQRTILLRRLMYALQDIAKNDPTDIAKQEAAAHAEKDVTDALEAAGVDGAALLTSQSDIASMPAPGPFPPGPK